MERKKYNKIKLDNLGEIALGKKVFGETVISNKNNSIMTINKLECPSEKAYGRLNLYNLSGATMEWILSSNLSEVGYESYLKNLN